MENLLKGCQLMQMVVMAVGDNLNLTYCTVHYMVTHITRKTSCKERGFHENYTLKFNISFNKVTDSTILVFFRHLASLKFPSIFVNDTSDLNNAHKFCNMFEGKL